MKDGWAKKRRGGAFNEPHAGCKTSGLGFVIFS